MASTIAPRWAVIDDMDPRVHFIDTGADVIARDDMDKFIGTQRPYASTLHGITDGDSELVMEFTFNGTAVRVVGYSDAQTDSTSSNPRPSELRCIIDGFPLSPRSAVPDYGPEEKCMDFCEWTGGPPGIHTLVFRGRSQLGPLWIDKVEYIPTLETDLPEGSSILVQHDDKRILRYRDLANPGFSRVEAEFEGTKVRWLGYFNAISNPYNVTTSATWSIDNGEPVPFVLEPFEGAPPVVWRHQYFESPRLSPGPHHLTVVYETKAGSSPLNFSHLLIETGPTNSSSPSQNDPEPSPTSSATSVGQAQKTPAGIIAGCVVGGLAIIGVTILAFVILRRRRRIESVAPASSANVLNTPPVAQSTHGGVSYTTSTQYFSKSPSFPLMGSGQREQHGSERERVFVSDSSTLDPPRYEL